MSLEENPKEEFDATQKIHEIENKQAKDRKSRKEKVKPLAKVVIRRLPPTMTEEEFLKQIEPVPDHDYFYFVPADWSLGVNATCRAYINFCNQNDIFIFRDKFDGYVFVDTKGTEYPAIVEFAPFQGLPKGKSRKKDQKANTIENEPHYLAFLESLKEEEAEGKSELKMEYSFQIKDDQKITSTPLLEYLANVRQERRDERKRKVEDRKRQREEEKQRKKNQLAKSMPKTIEEDSKELDDGIVVRTIKSRPMDRDRNKGDRNADGGGGGGGGCGKSDRSEKSEGSSRAERDRARNKERQARRKEERERHKKEREEKKNAASAAANEPTYSKNEKDSGEKVKKYSDSRRDRKKRNEAAKINKNEQKDAEKNTDGNTDERSAQRTSSTDDSKNGNETAEMKAQKDRAITNMRNKDRPSIQIYQPGRRRTASGHDNSTGNEYKSQTSLEMEYNEGNDTEKPSTSSTVTTTTTSSGADNRKRNDKKESSKGHSDDSTKKSTSEKRISRYSEKRNKVKEKRDLTDNPSVANDYNSNATNKEITDEIS